jgi:hypothetical protein
VSLILDALRKLERERETREPGVLVVGSVPWGEGRRSRRPLAFACLALVAAVCAGWWWSRPTPRPAGPVPSSTPVAAAPSPADTGGPVAPPAALEPRAPTPSASVPPARRLAVPTLDEEARPPAPGEAAPATAPPRVAPNDLHLNAITRRDGRPVALINDRLVFEGDSFDGVRIVRIGEDEVEVEVQGHRRLLRF